MLGVFAEFERVMIRERVMAGLARACSEGKQLGRRPLERAKARKVKGALALRAQGIGIRRIAREVGLGVGTPFRSLTRPGRPSLSHNGASLVENQPLQRETPARPSGTEGCFKKGRLKPGVVCWPYRGDVALPKPASNRSLSSTRVSSAVLFHYPLAIACLDETIRLGDGGVAKDRGMMHGIDAMQAARHHMASALVMLGRKSRAESAEHRGERNDGNELVPGHENLLFGFLQIRLSPYKWGCQ